jgi:hypothetical protein
MVLAMSGKPLQEAEGVSPKRLQQALDRKVRDRTGRSLELYIADLRDRGDSFATVAVELRMLTGRAVSYESIRVWCREWGIE